MRQGQWRNVQCVGEAHEPRSVDHREERDGTGWRSTEAWERLRALGKIFRVQRECMYQQPANDVSQVRLATTQWEVKWKAMMSELGGDSWTPDLWRMSAVFEICPKDVKEQMMMRLDEIGENCENLKARVVSYTTNKTEQARGAQKDLHVPMEVRGGLGRCGEF